MKNAAAGRREYMQDTAKKQNDFFQNEFQNEKPDTTSKKGKVVESEQIAKATRIA